MTAITARGEVGADRTLRVAVPCDLPPGPVDVVVKVANAESNGLPPELAEHLAGMESYADDALWWVARQQVPVAVTNRLRDLGSERSVRSLTPEEADEFERLIYECDRTILIRAKAAAMLRGRGHDISGLLTP